MPTGLIETLLEAHAVAGGAETVEGAAEAVELRPDHMMLAERAAPLVLPALHRLPFSHARSAVALMCADPHRPPGALEVAGSLADLEATARAHGLHVAPPGAGHAAALFMDQMASPGRLVVACGDSLAAAGALGTLALECGELEMAALLGGATLRRARPRVVSVLLRGKLPAHLGGFDVALELARRLAPAGARGAWIEVAGHGVSSLGTSERVAFVITCVDLGAAAALFPSDETTHEYMRARGRDSDWKRLEPEPGTLAERHEEIVLEDVEPQAAEPGRLDHPRALGSGTGPEVRRVVFGPAATVSDLRRLAAWLAGREVAPGTSLIVEPGSRDRLARLVASGALEGLSRAGARILASEPIAPAAGLGGAPAVCCGIAARELHEARGPWWMASAESCAVAALAGRLVDPRSIASPPAPLDEAEVPATSGPALLAPLPESGSARAGNGAGRFPVAPVIEGALRGVVLIAAGDRVGIDPLLPWGARLAPLDGDIGALAEHVCAGLDPGFAARARAHGGGFIVAGEALGAGPPRVQAALALVELGVRAALAESFGPAFHDDLVLAGVLPLRFVRATDRERIRAGDEIELPTLPDGLEPGRPLVVRNLTRGTQLTAQHDLTARDVAVLRAGGLVAFTARGVPAVHRGAA